MSQILGTLKGDVVRTPAGWEVTASGIAKAKSLSGGPSAEAAKVASGLRTSLRKITNTDARPFLAEAVSCYESKLYRAAVVLSWVGAPAVLYDHTIAKHLAVLNSEAKRRDPKWRDAKTADDLARLKEFDYLQILETISAIGKSVKVELEACLKLRNGCGHPNSLKISESRVAAHLEVLTLNVFAVFS